MSDLFIKRQLIGSAFYYSKRLEPLHSRGVDHSHTFRETRVTSVTALGFDLNLSQLSRLQDQTLESLMHATESTLSKLIGHACPHSRHTVSRWGCMEPAALVTLTEPVEMPRDGYLLCIAPFDAIVFCVSLDLNYKVF